MDRRWTPRIIVLSGLVLAILCDAFVAHVLSVNYWETYRAADAANGDLARALEEYMLRNMQGIDLLLGTTIDDLEENPSLLTAGNPVLINELKHRVTPYPAANAIVVLDADGNVLGDSLGNGAPGRELNFADRTYFKAQRDDPGRGLFIDVPVASRVRPERRFIGVSRAFLTPDRRFGGVVFVPLDYNSLRHFFLSLNVGQRGTVTLYRDDGTLLLRTPNADAFAGRDVRSFLLFTALSPASAKRKLHRQRIHGRDITQRQLPAGRRHAAGGDGRTRPGRVSGRMEEQCAVVQPDCRRAQSADRGIWPGSGAAMAPARRIRNRRCGTASSSISSSPKTSRP